MGARLVTLGVLAMLALTVTPTASAAKPRPVTITVAVTLSGDLEASTTAGTFSMIGTLADAGSESGSGRFAGQGHLRSGDPNSLHSTMLLTGSNGSVSLDLVGLFGPLPAPIATGEGRWVLTAGTGDYAGLAGRGTWTAVADFRDAFAHIGPPRVTFTIVGSVN